MAKEETTLEKMRKFRDAVTTGQMQVKAATNEIEALASGTNANIDNLFVRIMPDGRITLTLLPQDATITLSERQFLGLMGWGRKHVGEGPNGKD
ncbi:MAG TPA: hypothetical protein VMY35_07590 [Phycisphaerae bacterium]|nr:hypothetical protein [Phycisphaerae bacterium]